MMRYLLICLLFGLPISLYAQRENSFWPLGYPTAVDFAGNTPKLVPVPVTYFFGGGASICDANGEVLFYTNGMAFFTKDHQVMPGTENFSDHRAATYYKWYMYDGADSLDYVSINNFFNTDIKVVQLNKAIPRYHVFYLMYPTKELLFNGGMLYVDHHKTELPKLVYGIIDMSLNNGKGGIDPNYKDVVVAENVSKHFDIMSDGQCGVWIVVNKFNQVAKPQLQSQGHSQLQSYLLQPSGNIVLVHSQAEFYMPSDYDANFPPNYTAPIIRFLGNGKYLSTQYEFDNGGPTTTHYGLYFNKVLLRSFDTKTGSIVPTIDTFVNLGDTATNGVKFHEHDIYITDNQQYIYTIGYDNLYSYDAQLIGNPIALQQSRTTFDLVSYMQQYYNYPNTAYSFTENTRFRKGPDNMLYFIFNMHNAANHTNISNRLKTILARIPNLDAPISANNIEIVDTANALQQFENFANYIQNHPNEIKLRGGPKTHLVASPHPGAYIQTGTNAIIYEPSTVPKLLIDTIICEGQSYYVHAPYPQYDNHWQPTNSTSDSLLIQAPGSYTLTTTAPHCTFSAAINVSLHEEQLIIPQNDTTICVQRPLNLSATLTGLSSVQWNTGSKETSIMVQESGQYIATAHGLCGTHADTVTVLAEDCSCLHFVPNAFTPNNDGLNDKLYTYLHCSPNHYRFWVYDRWGKMVWFSDQVTEHWDGSQKGKPCDVGVYFYYMQYRDPLNQLQEHRGEVHLMR